MSANKKNLVLGAVRGYNFEQLRPFVVSLQRTAFKGDLVLLWNSLSPETLAALEAEGVKLVHFSYRGSGALNSWSRFWPQLRPLLLCPVGDAARQAVYKKILNLAFVRYVHALEFLQAHRGEYENVLLTDVRDVIFQDDPFRDPLPADITAFLEAPHMKFGAEPMNDEWIAVNYGAEMTEKLKGTRISCCGTVMGTQAGMVDYLEVFLGEVIKLHSLEHGADTSIHNVIAREHFRDRVAIIENLVGAVGTVGANAMGDLKLNQEGLIVQPGGWSVPVLHQYDRHAEFAARLIARLPEIK